MFESYILYLAITAFLAGQASRAVTTVTASVYDSQNSKAAAGKQPRGRKPVISVLVHMQNHARTIEACLDSITKTSLRTYEVIVIDNASTDNGAKIVRAYIQQHKSAKIRLVRKRTKLNAIEAYKTGSRTLHGNLVLLLQGDAILGSKALKDLQGAFMLHKDMQALRLNVQPLSYPSFITELQQIDAYEKSQGRKLAAVLEESYEASLVQGVAYRKKEFQARLKQKHAAWRSTKLHRYAGNIYMYAQPDLRIQSLVTLPQEIATLREAKTPRQRSMTASASVGRIVRTAEPLAFIYFFYLAYSHKNSTLFLLMFACTIFWLGLLISSEASGERKGKAGRLLLAPLLAIFLFTRALTLLVGQVVYVFWYETNRAFARLFKILQRRIHLSRGAVDEA